MRNTTLRQLINGTTENINDAIKAGIEPLAIAFTLRQMADQCDKLAEEFERQEKEAAEKEVKEAVEAMAAAEAKEAGKHPEE